MKINKNIFYKKARSIATSVSSFLIPFFQYVPCTGVWFGIMSVPFIAYLSLFFQNPGILSFDLNFLIRTHEIYIVLFGFILFIYSLIYQMTHRKQLLRSGPYKYIRHPQYLAFIIMTFGMTLIAFQTSPIFNFNLGYLNGYTILLYIWVGEVFAYVVLAKIEEIALKAKYGESFLEYVNDVAFMIPFLKLKRNKSENE
ncbi:MAG: methyltransferase family protein [Candidatus Hermodarchaeota archaeon]